MRYLLTILILTQLGVAQTTKDVSLSPIVAYWKTLTQEEKEIYLFSYLTQVYETYAGLKQELGYGDITSWYYKNRAEMVFGIFDQLEETDINEFVGWIDEFYSHENFMDHPFHEALAFAFRFQQAYGETIGEKYGNLKYDRIKPK